ncbi:hypothetical protein BpHYR1_026459 [Brachionus plicatilis]|uniref:Uncharacterized protein n=1 Tax=Brachionus plicatilis TaxID=10195 RepID=A0A3M7QWR3_BRAPC|nr:hypothetical protein BpHYR1_026459 [Brachionus plicatilis]
MEFKFSLSGVVWSNWLLSRVVVLSDRLDMRKMAEPISGMSGAPTTLDTTACTNRSDVCGAASGWANA